MRKKIVAGNWKMNNNLDQTKTLIKELKKQADKQISDTTRVIIAPSFVNLNTAVKKTKKSNIEVAAQNMHQAENGAFTGEISADMLTNLGLKLVILGHSERREYFGETDAILAQKVTTALQNNLEVIFCFGEVLEDRKLENHFEIVENQLKNGLFHLKKEDFKNIILAYEPVWAIGTGETASAGQAQEIHSFVRKTIAKKYGNEIAENISILYGGSVKPENAKEIFSKQDVDGGLIGGAALNAKDFLAIVNAI
ncbi:triose-phosphate isomerase [Tenacibaculum piscium]|uniref:Triosephosphate isomerase n=1 Tax=Tenacibaculum piscium TaxID=1458515 RepID=A0A2H1YIA2_9FLAO|nr:triose-phosphate isomerase [Tenacibaculum piscium]MBE7628446.1 triose-phosphate isomerase [Tenacibaculum piscium]MBE7669586.1 triose-phosphate isomerase [Tenacibaculum piscium]SOS75234.1 Triosephosphate isomerase [Tenacibaculum piscium]